MEKVACLFSLELSSIKAGEYLTRLSAIFKPPAFSIVSRMGVIFSNLLDRFFSPIILKY
jgi:hypothetical protein